MQSPAVPELAHTHTRPIHWVATATALAGVVALSSLTQPGAATAAQTPAPETKSAPARTAPPDPAAVEFPLECGPVGVVVKKHVAGDLDGDGRPETVAAVHCDAAMGTPPDGMYVLTRAAGSDTPRLVATLVDPGDRTNVDGFAVRDGGITAALLGYSSTDVPRCCPDVRESVKWHWDGGVFVRSEPSGARSV
ncbi:MULTISPECIES: hypothetical protein [Streptomyces]|uniref:hypothetical protein n=1 Tax=Streptomyces TaxID=1883 RepID=UPI0007ED6F0E|nr:MULTISPECIES: hypothetical protein [unclassified Streptomyces]MCP3770552.1 hypothetical protein [Streptomyces sp. MAR25Y5]OBQ49759.1 hypothetical protein A4U61_19065 [Streptomyces sp. H-KF8]